SSQICFQNQETATSFFQVLATIYRDEREYSKKIYDVGNTEHLIETASAEQLGYVVVRILKFNPQFQEFIDVDRNVDIRNLDRFQLFLSCKETESSQPMATSVSQAQHTQVSQEHEKLRSILEKKAPETLDELKTKGTVTEKARIKLVKLRVSDLVEKHGFTEKVALAKNIIAVFPSLRVQVDGNGEGFEHFYDPDSHSGFLEMRLRNIRRKLEDGQRSYRSNKRRCEDGPNPDKEEEDGSGTSEWINLMKRLRPSTDNISSIKAAMQKTFTWRRSWIAKHSPSLSEIFEEYLHFLDMPTLLDTEFGKMFEGKGDLFLRRWEATIIPKLKAIAIMETGDLASLKDMENQNEGIYFQI
ncbi:hypothetical protein AMEX_G5993, partial [Astyanax mexicanus]